jgi:adenylate kinase family enzyme
MTPLSAMPCSDHPAPCTATAMRRILVTGNAGAGKTSLARRLAMHTGLPYVGLDKIVWKPGWLRTPVAERRASEEAAANGPCWVVDGVSMAMMQAADTIIFLDYPRHVCFWRALCRNVPYLFRSRPGLPERCPEILIAPTLAKMIWNFPALVRPKILDACRSDSQRFVHIRTNQALSQFMATLGAPCPKANLSTRPDHSCRHHLRGESP